MNYSEVAAKYLQMEIMHRGINKNNNDMPRGTEISKCTVQWSLNYNQVLPDDGPCGRNM
jgi:hypothetical protein